VDPRLKPEDHKEPAGRAGDAEPVKGAADAEATEGRACATGRARTGTA
jgi:hypothetical protein